MKHVQGRSVYVARETVRQILLRGIAGDKGFTMRNRIRRAKKLAGDIFGNFEKLPHEWQIKHINWLRTHVLKLHSKTARYDYFLALKAVLECMGRWEKWGDQLQREDWSHPSGAPKPKGHAGRKGKKPIFRVAKIKLVAVG